MMLVMIWIQMTTRPMPIADDDHDDHDHDDDHDDGAVAGSSQ
jgi:hypothetical protein